MEYDGHILKYFKYRFAREEIQDFRPRPKRLEIGRFFPGLAGLFRPVGADLR